MMKIKTVFFDLDGTLLNSQHQISNKSKDAILKIQKLGIDVILASGRSVQNMMSFAKEINSKYIIAFNGSVIYSVKNDKILYEQKMVSQAVIDSCKYAIKNTVNAVFYAKKQSYILKESPNYNLVNDYFNTKNKIFSYNISNHIYKIIIIAINNPEESIEHLVKLKKYLENHDVEITRSSCRSVEINYKNISKASGINFLQNYLDINLETCAAFGNGGNDLEMLRLVKYPFIMGNSIVELEKTGFEIIGNNNSNAIANKLNSFITIAKEK